MFAVRSVQTLAEWQALKPVWQTLVDADSRATLCNTWEWNDAWVRQFWQAHFEMRVFVVEKRADNHVLPLALLPLYMDSRTLSAQMVGTGEPEASEVASEYLDLLLDESQATLEDVTPVLLQELQRLRCRTIHVANCLQSSRILALLAALPRVEKNIVGRQFGIALSQSLAEVMQQFSYKQRKNGQLVLNRFDKNPVLSCEVLVGTATGNLWEQLQELHQADWTARQKPGAFASADFIRFHEWLQRSGDTVQPKFSVLRHDGEVIAVHYYYQFRQQVYYYQSGTVKDRFQQYSPGKMLHMLAFRQLAGGGLYYDFMKGAVQGSYKAAMCPEGELFYSAVAYRSVPRWWMACVKRWLKLRKTKPRESGGSEAAEPQAD